MLSDGNPPCVDCCVAWSNRDRDDAGAVRCFDRTACQLRVAKNDAATLRIELQTARAELEQARANPVLRLIAHPRFASLERIGNAFRVWWSRPGGSDERAVRQSSESAARAALDALAKDTP